MALKYARQAWGRSTIGPLSTSAQVTIDAFVVLAATIVGALGLRTAAGWSTDPLQGQASPLLAAVTAGAAAVIALLCVLNSCLQSENEMRLASYAWGFYALVVMPVSVVDTAPGVTVLPGATAPVVAVFLVLLAATFADSGPRWLSGFRAIAGGVGLTALIVGAVGILPPHIGDFLDSDGTKGALLAGWGLLASAFIIRGLRRQSPVWYRMGFALVLMAAAHVLLMASGIPMVYAVLRFIGFLVLLAALCLHTRAGIAARHAANAEAAERTAAQERAESQRRHEIRNALATLSSVTTLMTPRYGTESAIAGRSISAMVDEELSRLGGLVEDAVPRHDPNSATVDAVLARLVTLRRAAGDRITLDAPPGIVVNLPTATLAQVVTNLLANCARHAPGVEVQVSAYHDVAGCCVVEVTDAGPGLDPTAPTTGDGLGLALSSELVEAAGGSLELQQARRFPTGTTALIHLPLTTTTSRHLMAVPPQRRVAS